MHRIPFYFLATVIFIITVSGCSSRWEEEVLLSDGRTIVIQREVLRESGGDEWAVNRKGSKLKQFVIRFQSPDEPRREIEWRGVKTSPTKWPEHPLILDVESGHFIVFSEVGDSAGCGKFSKYIESEGVWIEERLPESFEPKISNLLIHDYEGMSSHVSLEKKRKRNADVMAAPFMRVGPKLISCW